MHRLLTCRWCSLKLRLLLFFFCTAACGSSNLLLPAAAATCTGQRQQHTLHAQAQRVKLSQHKFCCKLFPKHPLHNSDEKRCDSSKCYVFTL